MYRFCFYISVVECPDFPIVGNASRSGNLRTYGSAVSYTCPLGYYINNTGDNAPSFLDSTSDVNAIITCLADGSWSHEPEPCLGASVLLKITNVNIGIERTVNFCHNVSFSCLRTYQNRK